MKIKIKYVVSAVASLTCLAGVCAAAHADNTSASESWLNRNWDIRLGYYSDKYASYETLGFDYNIFKTKDHSLVVNLFDHAFETSSASTNGGTSASYGISSAGLGLQYRFLGGEAKSSTPFVKVDFGSFLPTASISNGNATVVASGTSSTGYDVGVGITFANNKDFLYAYTTNAGNSITKNGWGVEYGTNL